MNVLVIYININYKLPYDYVVLTDLNVLNVTETFPNFDRNF